MTTNAPTPAKYDGVLMWLHWIIATLIIGNIALAFYFGDLPRHDPALGLLVTTHKSLGLSVLVLSVILIIWRLTHRAPALPANMTRMHKIVAKSVQGILYFLIVAIPFAGWGLVSSSPRNVPVHFFGLFTWPQLPVLSTMAPATKKVVVGQFAQAHELLAWAAIVLVTLHVLGALYHHFLARDNVLRNILPGGR